VSNLPRSNGVLGEAGFGAFSLVRLLVFVVVLMMLVGSAGQCAQRAPQLAGNAAAGLGQAAATGVSSLLSAATSAAYCALPFVNCSPNSGGEAFAQCFASNGRPSPRCTTYSSIDDAAASALVLARLGTKCADLEFAGVIYRNTAAGFTFVGPFVGQHSSADFTVSFQLLQKLGMGPQNIEAAYHSHPADSWTHFSLQDMETAASWNRPSYLVGTNRLGDGEVVKFTPKQLVPKDWHTGWFGNLFSWTSFREFWYDWTSPPVGDVTSVVDLGSAGELVDRARQCPAKAY
jgi:hypothetical protein